MKDNVKRYLIDLDAFVEYEYFNKMYYATQTFHMIVRCQQETLLGEAKIFLKTRCTCQLTLRLQTESDVSN